MPDGRVKGAKRGKPPSVQEDAKPASSPKVSEKKYFHLRKCVTDLMEKVELDGFDMSVETWEIYAARFASAAVFIREALYQQEQ